MSHLASDEQKDTVSRRHGLLMTAFLLGVPRNGASSFPGSPTLPALQAEAVHDRGVQAAVAAGEDVLHVEIFGVLNSVAQNHSFHTCEKSGDLFCVMSPDSAMASKFAGRERKCNYLIPVGIAPFSESQLVVKVKFCSK